MLVDARKAAAGRDFPLAVLKQCGQKVERCYQCGKCTAGCPAAREMDMAPNQVIRLLQLGLEEQVLGCRAIWLCASCATCTSRCPQDVDLAAVMDALRQLALRRGYKVPEKEIAVFNRVFLFNVAFLGRLFEPAVVGLNNLFSGHLFKDVLKAPRLLLSGKLPLLPGRPDPLIRDICRRVRRIEEAEE